MPLLPDKTQPERVLDQDALIYRAQAEAVNNLIQTQRAGFNSYWYRADEDLLESLNRDPAQTLQMFQRNAQLFAALNKTQDFLDVRDEHGNPRYPDRAILVGRTDIDFKNGAFSIKPPVPPVPPIQP